MTPEEYMRDIMQPTIKELVQNRTSKRHAFLACVVTYHMIDYLCGKRRKAVLRGEYRVQSAAFAAVDRIAHGRTEAQSGRARSRVGETPVDLAAFAEGEARLAGEGTDILKLVNEAADFLAKKAEEHASQEDQPATIRTMSSSHSIGTRKASPSLVWRERPSALSWRSGWPARWPLNMAAQSPSLAAAIPKPGNFKIQSCSRRLARSTLARCADERVLLLLVVANRRGGVVTAMEIRSPARELAAQVALQSALVPFKCRASIPTMPTVNVATTIAQRFARKRAAHSALVPSPSFSTKGGEVRTLIVPNIQQFYNADDHAGCIRNQVS